MSADKYFQLPVTELRDKIVAKEVSPVELVQLYLDRIEKYDKTLNGYITVCSESALDQARNAEDKLTKGGDLGPLFGIPYAIKDQVYTDGILTTNGSTIYGDFVPDFNGTVEAKLKAAGGILLGKLNMSEFASGDASDHPYGLPKNPWDITRNAGTSSSGSGIAAAADLSAFVLGEDTGGSIRGPAAFCGLAGIRPSFGRVSRYGVFGASWSMDTVGPLSRYVKDSALVLSVIAGHDPNDPYSSKKSVPEYASLLNSDISKLKIGLIKERLDPSWGETDVFERFNVAVNDLKNLGAQVVELSLPNIDYSAVASATLINIDASYLNRGLIENQLSEFDYNNQIRLLSGAILPAVVHKKINAIREIVRNEILDALEQVDVLILPTSPIIAPKIPVKKGMDNVQEMVDSFGGRRQFTSPFNLANVPAMSVCCGFSDGGMPVGLQIVGKPFDEQTIFDVAYAYESATDWHKMRPNLETF
tara:strand:- start:2172 stop:3596 length:1425 start_codon:yes stop_codon:yes gene_type:complete